MTSLLDHAIAGTDHRSPVCAGLTSQGIEPPEIDLWAYDESTGRTRAIEG